MRSFQYLDALGAGLPNVMMIEVRPKPVTIRHGLVGTRRDLEDSALDGTWIAAAVVIEGEATLETASKLAVMPAPPPVVGQLMKVFETVVAGQAF